MRPVASLTNHCNNQRKLPYNKRKHISFSFVVHMDFLVTTAHLD